MRVDRPRRQEKPCRHLLVGHALSDQARHLEFLGRQLQERARIALASRLAGGAKLGTRALRPDAGIEALERRDSVAELFPRDGAATLAAKMLPVQEPNPGEIEWPHDLRLLHRLLELLRRVAAARDERAAARQSGHGPRCPGVGCPGLERGKRGDRFLRAPEPDERLHPIRDGKDRCERVPEAGTHLGQGVVPFERALPVAAGKVDVRERPDGERRRKREAVLVGQSRHLIGEFAGLVLAAAKGGHHGEHAERQAGEILCTDLAAEANCLGGIC
jgi:hypothetical protein